MNVVFNRTDFTLCDVPVPKGYPQSQTHAGIACHNGIYYLTTSPYPSVRRNIIMAYARAAINKLTFYKLFDNRPSDSFENPCLYVGCNNGPTPPTRFLPLTNNPLMQTPDSFYGLPSFNSDPDIFIEDENIYVLNRVVYRRPIEQGRVGFDCRLFLIKGKLVDGKYRYMGTIVLLDDEICGSPSLLKYNGKYVLFSISSTCYNDGSQKFSLSKMISTTVEGFNNRSKWENVDVEIEGFTPWHLSVFSYNNAYYAIVACVKHGDKQRCWQMFGQFNDDLSCLKIFKTPLSDYNSYRGAAWVDNRGEFVLYNTTVHEKIQRSRSVDGRNVIMTHMPFVDFINLMKK